MSSEEWLESTLLLLCVIGGQAGSDWGACAAAGASALALRPHARSTEPITARPERSMAAARLKTALVAPEASVKCQLAQVLAIGWGASGVDPSFPRLTRSGAASLGIECPPGSLNNDRDRGKVICPQDAGDRIADSSLDRCLVEVCAPADFL